MLRFASRKRYFGFGPAVCTSEVVEDTLLCGFGKCDACAETPQNSQNEKIRNVQGHLHGEVAFFGLPAMIIESRPGFAQLDFLLVQCIINGSC